MITDVVTLRIHSMGKTLWIDPAHAGDSLGTAPDGQHCAQGGPGRPQAGSRVVNSFASHLTCNDAGDPQCPPPLVRQPQLPKELDRHTMVKHDLVGDGAIGGGHR